MRLTRPLYDDGADRPVLGVTRSATGRVWRDRLDAAGHATALAIGQRLGVADVVARVVAGRGVAAEDAAAFLDPSIKSLMPDPSALTDMDAAASRLADAVERREPIAIFGDYDVDGATSSALLARYLRAHGLDPVIYIPDRMTEGYGPNPEAIRALAKAGARLLVTLDCGTTSFDALEAARAERLDVIVADHHQCGPALPPAVAVVNPNRHDDLSHLGHLAAVGVTFILVVALNRELRRRGTFKTRPEPDLLALLDLVALGTIADVVPLTGLNRAFVVKGLMTLRRRGNAGLAALTAVARLSGPVSPYHLGFMIGPRINAGGRIGDAGLGARLLATDDPVEAEIIAAELDRLNKERQAIEQIMLEQAETQVLTQRGGEPGPVIVTADDRWHPGVVGLIAARLKERYQRPAFAIAFDAGPNGTGSGRSIAGVDLGGAVRAAVEEGLLIKGGGHAMAAGLTVARAKVEALTEFLTERLGAAVSAASANQALKIDAALTASGASAELVAMLDKAGPYGSGHAEPLFALPAHRVAFADEVGAGHLRVSLVGGDGSSLKAMAFRASGEPLGKMIAAHRGRPLHVAGSLSLDHWQGDARVQLRIIDVADPATTSL